MTSEIFFLLLFNKHIGIFGRRITKIPFCYVLYRFTLVLIFFFCSSTVEPQGVSQFSHDTWWFWSFPEADL